MVSRTFLGFLVLLGFLCTQAEGGWIWTPQTRRWVNPKYAAKDTPSTQMDWALHFFEAGDYERSAKEFLKLVRTFPRSTLAPEAQYLMGVSYEMLDKPAAAFAAYRHLVEIYPFSARFKDTIEREYGVAEAFFAGKRLKLLGPVSLPSLDKAVEIYQHIVQQAPYGDYGDEAQFRLGQCRLKQRLYEEAHRAFQRLAEEYPNSPLVEAAKFNVAFCSRQLSLSPSYDQSATDEAITWFEQFIAAHPASDLVAQAQESLEQLRGFKAQALLESAQFYEVQGKRTSALLYYRMVVERYPKSPSAAQALARLTELEKASAANP